MSFKLLCFFWASDPYFCLPTLDQRSFQGKFPKSFPSALVQPKLHVPILLQYHLFHALIYNRDFTSIKLLIYVCFSPLDLISWRVRTSYFRDCDTEWGTQSCSEIKLNICWNDGRAKLILDSNINIITVLETSTCLLTGNLYKTTSMGKKKEKDDNFKV